MKSFVCLLFVSFLFWNYIGFFAYFQLEKASARREFKRKLKLAVPKDDLRTFHFSQKEAKHLIWHKAHEFELDGRMYDIVYSDTAENGDLIYSCISDIQETVLFEKLSEYVAKDLNSDKHKPLKKLKINLEQPSVVLEYETFDYSVCDFYKTKKVGFHYSFSVKPGYTIKNTPPPKFQSC